MAKKGKKIVFKREKPDEVLLEKDRAESRRLAIEEVEKRHPARGNAEESYACTVCRKCFHNYSNMCRHRRLAHYKDSKVDDFYGLEDEEEVGRVSIASHQVQSLQQAGHQVGVSTRSSGVVSVELGYKHFLAVARNIPKNLEFFIEGTQQDLNNAKNHIKWKDNLKSHFDGTENDVKEDAHASDESSFTTIPNVSLEDYNFPKGFQITSKVNHLTSELELPMIADSEKSLENEEVCEPKKEIEPDAGDDKTFLKFCSNCKMNFADENGFAIHVLSCSSLAEVPRKATATLTEDVHDYSRKANPVEEAYKVFPELSKLPINLFSSEEILDLSRHKNCVFMSSVDANGMSFPCTATSEEPLDLTGSKQKKILPNSTSADYSSVAIKSSSEFKSSTPIKSPTSPILNFKEEVNSPSPQSRSFTNGLVSAQQSTQMINIKPHKKIICLVCYMSFTDKEKAMEHQESSHGNVDCRHAEVDEDFEISMLKVPKPDGLLSSSQIVFTCVADKLKDESLQNVEQTNEAISEATVEEPSKEVEKEEENPESSLKVDEVDVSTEELLMTVVSEATMAPPDAADLGEDAVVCTKCRLRFTDLSALHGHISESCGDYWRNLSDRVSWVFVLRGNLVPPEREQPSGTNQPKKRGKFKWHQNSNPPLFRSNSSNDESLRKQLQSSGRNGTSTTNLEASRKLVANKVLTRKRSQEIGAAVMSAMEDPDYYVRSKRRAFLQQQNLANASKKGMKRQTSLDLPPKLASTLMEGSDSNQANSSLDEETLANLSGEGFNEDNNDDDDDYDPNKFMCIYCRHQFQYTRTLRKHVLEFCHVRREYVENGEYLDVEWEDDLNSKVQPPPVAQSVAEVTEDNEEVKKSGGRKRKRRSWCSRGCSNNNKHQPPASQSHDLSSEVKQYSHLPVQLQLSLDHAQMLRETKNDSSDILLSIPMTTPGGTIVVKADDVHNGESDLMVSCDSIPNEVEDEIGGYERSTEVVSKLGNVVAASTSSATPNVIIQSADGGLVRAEQPSNATDVPDQFRQTLPQHQETTRYSSSTAHFSIALDTTSNRFEDDDNDCEEDEGSTGLMMTVTSSPAVKQPQDSPWEAPGKRRNSSELPSAKKKKKLDLGSSTSDSNCHLVVDPMTPLEDEP